MMLILGNTIAMGVRERTHEYGVLRAIGFLPGTSSASSLGEAVAARRSSAGCVGVALAYPFVNSGIGPRHRREHGGMVPVLPRRRRA